MSDLDIAINGKRTEVSELGKRSSMSSLIQLLEIFWVHLPVPGSNGMQCLLGTLTILVWPPHTIGKHI